MQIETREFSITGKKRIALILPFNTNIIDLIKQIEGFKWSASRKFQVIKMPISPLRNTDSTKNWL